MSFVFFPPKDKWRLTLSERSLFFYFWSTLGWVSVPMNRGYPYREPTYVSWTKHKSLISREDRGSRPDPSRYRELLP